MKTGIPEQKLKVAAGYIKDAEVDHLPAIQELKKVIAAKNDELHKAVEKAGETEKQVSQLHDLAVEHRKGVAVIEQQLPRIAADALLGDAAADKKFAEQVELLESRRLFLHKYELGGPHLRGRVTAAFGPAQGLGSQVNNLDEQLEKLRQAAKLKLAEQ